MASRDRLNSLIRALPEHRVQEVPDVARFQSFQEDRAAWQEFGRQQLARAYGDDEPDYEHDDIEP